MLIRLPIAAKGRPTVSGAAWLDMWFARFRAALGRGLNRIGAPGAIQPVDIQDKVTGQRISVSMGEFFVRLSVDGRDYYFDRLTGRFDGSGMGCG